MAACIVEDASTTTSIYCQTTNTMEQTPSPSSSSSSSLETTRNPEHHRCSFNFHTNNIKIDSTLIINQESTRKRRLSSSDTCNTRTITDSNCRSQTVSIDKNNESM